MNTNDFNYGQTIFLASFLAAELPSGLVSKKLGADRWIPFLICVWSVVAASQAGLQGRAGFFAIKALLGLLMGGFIPDVVLWLTYYYTSKELPTRLSWFVRIPRETFRSGFTVHWLTFPCSGPR